MATGGLSFGIPVRGRFWESARHDPNARTWDSCGPVGKCIYYNCWICAQVRRNEELQVFALAGGVPQGKLLCNHALHIDEGVGWSIADLQLQDIIHIL